MSIEVPLKTIWIAVGLAVVVTAIAAIVSIPLAQANLTGYPPGAPEYFEAANKARSTLLQGLGAILQGMTGLALSGTAYAAIRNLQVAEENRKIAEDKQVSERFAKAVEMLADEADRLDVKLGAIYALERLVKDSPEDRWPVVELLAAYVRRRSSINGHLKEGYSFPEDVQAALNVVVAEKAPVGKRINLSRAYLAKASLRDAQLGYADMTGANLQGARLLNAYLEQADIEGDLSRANFYKACLERVRFAAATLTEASFIRAYLKEANFVKCNLSNADFRMADLEDAGFLASDLSGADFRKARNLNLM